MRFMYIVTPVHPTPPTPELMEAVHKLAAREIEAGHLLTSGALAPRTVGAQRGHNDWWPAPPTQSSGGTVPIYLEPDGRRCWSRRRTSVG